MESFYPKRETLPTWMTYRQALELAHKEENAFIWMSARIQALEEHLISNIRFYFYRPEQHAMQQRFFEQLDYINENKQFRTLKNLEKLGKDFNVLKTNNESASLESKSLELFCLFKNIHIEYEYA